MEDFLNVVLWPSIYTFLGVLATKVFEWIKPKFQTKIDNADARAKELETEIKAAEFYKALLDDAKERLEQAIVQLEERDKRIKERDERIKERDEKIDLLIEEIETMTNELKKYKQLNGKA